MYQGSPNFYRSSDCSLQSLPEHGTGLVSPLPSFGGTVAIVLTWAGPRPQATAVAVVVGRCSPRRGRRPFPTGALSLRPSTATLCGAIRPEAGDCGARWERGCWRWRYAGPPPRRPPSYRHDMPKRKRPFQVEIEANLTVRNTQLHAGTTARARPVRGSASAAVGLRDGADARLERTNGPSFRPAR